MTTALPSPAQAATRGERVRGPVVLAGALLTVSLLLHLRDPHRGGSWGQRPWLLLTGTYCPGCGGLRAVNDLTRGDVGAAASSNLLFVASLPVLVTWWTHTVMHRWRGVAVRASSRRHVVLALAFSALAVAFWVLRNTGAGAGLAP